MTDTSGIPVDVPAPVPVPAPVDPPTPAPEPAPTTKAASFFQTAKKAFTAGLAAGIAAVTPVISTDAINGQLNASAIWPLVGFFVGGFALAFGGTFAVKNAEPNSGADNG